MTDPSPIQAYWSETATAISQRLGSTAQGLNSAGAAQKLADDGPNVLQVKTKVTPLGLLLNQFRSPIIIILLFATLVSAILREWSDATIILIIVVSSALLSFWQEYSADTATAKLQAQVSLKTNVLRDGVAQMIPAAEVVRGDIVLLSAGSLVPADGLLLEAKDLFVNQAVLTGETFPVEKQLTPVAAQATLNERTNCVFMGTNVGSGSGKALVVQTGSATAFGQIAQSLALRPPETEFERGIRRLGYLLTEIMLLLVLGIFAVNVFLHKPVIDSLLFSLALAVGLTPQLLPAIININLAKGAQRMAASGVIVRRLTAIENFGSMDILCTDKTGTLTVGVVQLDGALDVNGNASDTVFRWAYLNATYQTGLSNPLDEAITSSQQLAIAAIPKLDEIPYDFTRKRLSIVVEQDGTPLLITKGALNNVLAVCNRVQTPDGVAPLDASQRAQIDQQYQAWSAEGLRVLGVATRPLPRQATYHQADEQALIFAGFLLFLDPPKPGVQATVSDLAQLGVELKIITGDNKLVAQHLAHSIGLSITGVVTGADIRAMPSDALPLVVEQNSLFAEVDPNQKERIIHALQQRGHVVGYMGDGVNDAPSLHTADVGISVALAVDVAKEAADFVLLEHDLAVLHKGIIEGRTTFANTLKYVFMATSANFGNMFSMAGVSLLLPFLPMLPKQILLLNFLTDLPEMTIAGDSVDHTFIDRPHRWDIGFIRRFMLVFGTLSSLFDYLTFGLLFWLHSESEAMFHTGWFIESLVSATLVVFVLRTRLPFYRSRPTPMMIGVTLCVIGTTIALPYTALAARLGFVALPWQTIASIMGIVLLYVLVTERIKQWFYRHSMNAV